MSPHNSRAHNHRGLLGLVPIDLPIAVPSLPLVAPVLTNVVHGAATTNPTTTAQTTAQPASTPVNTHPTSSQQTGSSPSSPSSPSPPSTGGEPTGGDSGSDTGASQPQIPPAGVSASVDISVSFANPTVSIATGGGIPASQLTGVIQNAAAQPTGSDSGAQADHPGSSATLAGVSPSSGTGASPFSPGSTHSGGGDGGTDSSPSAIASHDEHGGIPGYAIGLVVTFIVIGGLFLALYLIRRRNIGKRLALRTQWSPVMVQNNDGQVSARSSFATNFDHGLRPPTPDDKIPSLPPPVLVTSRNSSDSLEGQYLFVDQVTPSLHPGDGPNTVEQPLPSPMSVRPFSPTESYRFPRPPSHISSPTGNNSNVTLIDLDAPNSPQMIQPLPALPTLAPKGQMTVVKRPFAPSLADELYIEPGESVNILDAFDDGWALVMKPNGLKGLAPLACFEETDEDVDIPAFLAAHKRRSSMPQFHQIGHAH